MPSTATASSGSPGPLGYIVARATPLLSAGPDAVVAAFGSISPGAIRWAVALLWTSPAPTRSTSGGRATRPWWRGLHEHAPAVVPVLEELGPAPVGRRRAASRPVGRVFFGAHLAMPRPADPLLSGWHAVNCLREWRGDTHWALVVAAGLTGAEASCLHNAWLGYEPDWLPGSPGSSADEIAEGVGGARGQGPGPRPATATEEGLALRQRLEDDTDRLTTLPWRAARARSGRSVRRALEPPCELLLARVDVTAGPNYQPASRVSRRRRP